VSIVNHMVKYKHSCRGVKGKKRSAGGIGKLRCEAALTGR
jgi:hypothetical protein